MIRELHNIDIAPYTSFGTSARVEKLIEWDNAEELLDFLTQRHKASPHPTSYTILGEGCNTLFTDNFSGTIIRSVAKGIEVVGRSEDKVFVRVAAGEIWDDVVRWSCEQGLWGAENLSAIPSSVGATAVQNIGAYGVEAKDIIEQVEYIDLSDRLFKSIAASECAFGYRESIFKGPLAGQALITSVTYRLSTTPNPHLDYGTLRPEVERSGKLSPMGIREAVMAIRARKLPDPKVIGNAGSFFKNPILPRAQVEALRELYPTMPIYEVAGQPEMLKIATGWMIDTLGWKGKRVGNVGVHSEQALVLVNHGGAEGKEVVALAERICSEVKERFGVDIFPEVNIVQ